MRRRWTVPVVLVALIVGSLAAPGVAATASTSPNTTVVGPAVLGVAAGADWSCAIRLDGTIACWGYAEGAGNPPAGTFTEISARYHSCGIRTDGTVVCWGYDEEGETKAPTGTFTAVSAGGYQSCGIRTDGSMTCWGMGGSIQTPTGRFRDVSAGVLYGCAIRIDETLACWGENESGQATPPTGTYKAIASGEMSSCAVRTDGTLTCWGDNSFGQSSPPSGTFQSIAAGSSYACAIRTNETLACWGGSMEDFEPLVPPAGNFRAISVGSAHACAIRTDGLLVCWGDDGRGGVTPRATTSMTAMPAWSKSTSVAARWSARPAFAAIASYAVEYRRAKWNGNFGGWTTWQSGLTTTTASIPVSRGYTYCFAARAEDADGVDSRWTRETCTAIPLDDRSLSRSSGWTAATGSAYYGGTILRATAYGAKLARTGVVARRIALLATTCRTCGKVKVYLNSTLLKTINLYSARTVHQKLFSVATFSAGKTGTLKIKVVSSGKRVLIDGLGIRRN